MSKSQDTLPQEDHQSQPERPARQRRGLIPPEVSEIVTPSLQVGAVAGCAGLFTGVTAGIIRDAAPVLFGVASGVQWFSLGSTYWLTRSLTLKTLVDADQTPSNGDKTKASAVAGGTAGMAGGLLRGPRNILPGLIVFSLVGGTGQALANSLLQSDTDSTKEKRSIFESKWSPLRKLSDEEYRDYLAEKKLKLDVEIALMNDKIEELRQVEDEAGETLKGASK